MAMTLNEETRIILRKFKIPMTAKEIYKEIKKRGHIQLRTATPIASLNSGLYRDIKNKGNKSDFIKIEKMSKIGKYVRYYAINKAK